MMQRFFTLLSSCLVVLFTSPLFAAPQIAGVPEELKPWIGWISEGHPEWRCGVVEGTRRCDWPGRVELSIEAHGASFRYFVSVDARETVVIPGGDDYVPLEVVAIGERGQFSPLVAVINRLPTVRLEPGAYEIRGSFTWREAPEALLVPPAVGVVTLTRDGRTSPFPERTDRGAVLIGRETPAEAQPVSNRLSADVYRVIQDDLPFRITTVLRLQVAGQVREVTFGTVVPNEGVAIAVASELETRLSNDQQLSVQVRPGQHEVRIDSIFPAPPASLRRPEGAAAAWPIRELWIWQPQESLRSVTVAGGTPIDWSQTSLPEEYRTATVLDVSTEDVVSFTTSRRGEVRTAANEIALNRQLWLDLSGGGFTARDTISGTMNQGWRLNAKPQLELGQVVVDGDARLITNDSSTNERGVELRHQNVALEATSRIAGLSAMFAHGWATSIKNLAVRLSLPPGWTLLGVVGADTVQGSWLQSWSLLDMFLGLLCATVIGRAVGVRWGIVAVVGMLLAHLHPGAPRFAWLHLVVSAALAEIAASAGLKRFLSFYSALTGILIAAMVVDFSIVQARSALFPAIFAAGTTSSGLLSFFAGLAESSIFGWSIMVGLLWGVVIMFTHHFLKGLLLSVFAFAGLVLGFSSGFDFGGSRGGSDYASSVSISMAPQAPQPVGKAAAARNRVLKSIPKAYSYDANEMAESGGEAATADKLMEDISADERTAAAVVQTGPGVPTWRWREYQIGFQGTVSADQTMSLWLISPSMNFGLAIVRVALIVALVIPFIPLLKRSWRQVWGAALVCLVIGANLLGGASLANAQSWPQPELLRELESRVAAEVCSDHCAVLGAAMVHLSGRAFTFVADVVARDGGSIALPGPVTIVGVERVLLDGRETKRVRRDEQGYLWVRLEPGAHQLRVEGQFLRGDVVELQFPAAPSNLMVDAPEWSVVGIGSGGAVQGVVAFTRKAVPSGPAQTKEVEQLDVELAPWFTFTRTVHLGQQWRVVNELARVGGHARAVNVTVPLLGGETVATDRVTLETGNVVVGMAAGESRRRWESRIEPAAQLALSATTGGAVSEAWVVLCGIVNRCRYDGLSPIASLENGTQQFLWRPYPGESVQIGVEKPGASGGRSVTIDAVEHIVTPGLRETEGSVSVTIRASQGTTITLGLPSGATVGSVLINGRDDTSRHQGTSVPLAIEAGASNAVVRYTLPDAPSLLWRAPAVTLSEEAHNVTTTINWGQRRWTWLLRGSSWGPAVLFWSRLLIVVVLAWLVARWRVTPLSFSDWVLLGLGTAALSVEGFLVPLVWLALLGLRSRRVPERRWVYNLSQIVLVVGGLITIAVMFEAVRSGLILQPDMGIAGNSSHDRLFRWYQDRTGSELLSPLVISTPLWFWRAFMLLWSAWVVLRIMNWARWIGKNIVVGGGWR